MTNIAYVATFFIFFIVGTLRFALLMNLVGNF